MVCLSFVLFNFFSLYFDVYSLFLRGVCYNVHLFQVFCFYIRYIFILLVLYAVLYLLPVSLF
jgi:hypothetical protein